MMGRRLSGRPETGLRMGAMLLAMWGLLGLLAMLPSVSGLTVFTINMANYNDHPYWPQRVELIAAAIIAADADVIGLQETRLDPDYPTTTRSYQNAAEQLLWTLNQHGYYLGARIVTQPIMYYPVTSCPMQKIPAEHKERLIRHRYSPEAGTCVPVITTHDAIDEHGRQTRDAESSYDYPLPGSLAPCNQTLFWEGISVISRINIEETGTKFLTKTSACTDANLRGTQFISFTLAGTQRFWLFNTHFGLDSVCQSDNAEQTAQYVQQMGNDGDLKVLVGDLNATPDAPALKYLRGAGLIDSWNQFHPTLPGYTYPSSNPQKRIDYIWANAPVIQSFVALNLTATQPNAQGIYPSDHYGLVMVINATLGN